MPASFRSLARRAAPGLLFFLAACQRPPVAVVNGRAISRAELNAELRVLQGVRPAAADDLATRRAVLDQLIRQELLADAARRAGLDKEPAFRSALEQRRGQVRQGLQRQISGLQAQLALADRSVETQALVDAWSQSQRPSLTVTVQDLQDAYKRRSRAGAMPPFQAVRDQLLDELILDRLVERERSTARIELNDGALQ